jgi:transposase
VAAAWQGKELLRAVYAAAGMEAAGAALQHLYRWADGVGVAELSRLARTVRAWEAEILAFHATGLLQRVDRGRQLTDQDGQARRARLPQLPNYRLRLLLHGGVRWQTHQTASLPGRSPRLVA